MRIQNPFPARATTSGDQILSGTCSEQAAIRLGSGNLNLSVNVIRVPTVGPSLAFNLYYNAQDDVLTTELGHKWHHDYMTRLLFDTWPDPSQVTAVGPDGSRFSYTGGPSWARDENYRFTAATLVEDSGEWLLEFPEGRTLVFEPVSRSGGQEGRLKRTTDRNGNSLTMTWDGSDRLVAVTEPTGRKLVLDYDATDGFLSTVTFDPTGASEDEVVMATLVVEDEELVSITGPEGCSLAYEYDEDHRITKRTDPRLKELSFEYDSSDRLIGVTDAESPPTR